MNVVVECKTARLSFQENLSCQHTAHKDHACRPANPCEPHVKSIHEDCDENSVGKSSSCNSENCYNHNALAAAEIHERQIDEF